MSRLDQPSTTPHVRLADDGRAIWWRQIAAILSIDLRKNLIGRRALLVYLPALLPVVLMFLLTVVQTEASIDISTNWGKAQELFANVYDALVLRTIVFFGCAWIFMNLFRGEIVDRSLHYYFLCATRREVLVAGKYLSGLAATAILFTLTTAGSVFFLYYPSNSHLLLDATALGQIAAYIGITLLACVGYGAVFLYIGLFFRNPIFPALIVYGWEWVNFLLPPFFRRISIIYYLESHLPYPIDEGPFATVIGKAPLWISLPGLLIFTGLVLLLAALRIRRMDIDYGGE